MPLIKVENILQNLKFDANTRIKSGGLNTVIGLRLVHDYSDFALQICVLLNEVMFETTLKENTVSIIQKILR
ncbi:hypothetical protein E2320_012005, partial [Naja naja]